MGCHHSYWLSYFSRWLKPPTSRCCFPCKNDKTCCEVTFSHVSEANLFKSWVSLNHTQIGIWRKHVSRGERTKREDQVNWNCCTVICPVASCHSFEYVVFTFCSQLEGFAGIGLEKRPESLNFSETSCFFWQRCTARYRFGTTHSVWVCSSTSQGKARTHPSEDFPSS